MHVLFWADGGDAVGVGHITRCTALAQGLLDHGHAVTLCTHPQALQAAHIIWGDMAPILCHNDFAQCTEKTSDYSWLVVDDYHIDSSVLAVCANPQRVMVIDDVPERSLHQATCVLNPNPLITAASYPTVSLTGIDYALVRRPFCEVDYHGREGAILVIMGGTDATGTLQSVITAVEPLGMPVRVVGFSQLALPPSCQALGWLSAEAMAGEMAGARLAIVALGSVVWEVLCVGVPCIGIEVVANQVRIADYLRRHSIAPVIHPDQCSQIPSIVGDGHWHKQPPRVDGKGAERVVQYMEQECRG